jgi:uncharacterized protein YegL
MKKALMIILVLISLSVTGWVAYNYLYPKNKGGILSLSRPHLDIFLLIDQSGSMKGDKMDPVPSDPEGIRVRAAQYFIDYLKYFADPRSRNRLSVINFGTDTPDQYQLPLTDMDTPDKIKQIKEVIQEHSLGYTNFHQALMKVKDFLKKSVIPGENRQPIVIIFTDGRPQDNRKLSQTQYFEELSTFIEKNLKNIPVEKAVRPVNFEFFIIALDARDAYWSKDHPFWEKIAPRKTYLMKKANEEELEGIYGKIIETIFTAQAGEWMDLESGGELKVLIPPYVEKMVISVKKDIHIKNQELQIVNPKGERVKTGENLIVNPTTGMNLYALIEPEAGEWKLSLTPSGKVRVKSDLLPTKLEINKPQAVHPLGEPFELVATFLRSDGTPVVPLSHYPLSFSATVKMPDGQQFHSRIVPDFKQGGIYKSEAPIPIKLEGIYEVLFEVSVGSFLKTGNFTLTKNTAHVEVKPIIHFKSTTPSMRKDYSIYKIVSFWKKSPFMIEGKFYRNGQEVPAQELASYKVDEIVLAQIEKERGPIISNVAFLKYDFNKNSFQGILYPDKHLSPGQYNLLTRTELPLADGNRYIREDSNSFSISYGWGILCWLIVAYLIFYVILQVLWRFARAPLRGQLYINGNPVNARLIDFFGINKARIVSRKTKLALPWVNTIKHDGDKNSSKTCPTFYVIGDRHKSRGRGTEPALVVYHRKFHVIPWWTKLHQGRYTTNISGHSIRWQP